MLSSSRKLLPLKIFNSAAVDETAVEPIFKSPSAIITLPVPTGVIVKSVLVPIVDIVLPSITTLSMCKSFHTFPVLPSPTEAELVAKKAFASVLYCPAGPITETLALSVPL